MKDRVFISVALVLSACTGCASNTDDALPFAFGRQVKRAPAEARMVLVRPTGEATEKALSKIEYEIELEVDPGDELPTHLQVSYANPKKPDDECFGVLLKPLGIRGGKHVYRATGRVGRPGKYRLRADAIYVLEPTAPPDPSGPIVPVERVRRSAWGPNMEVRR